MSTATKALAAAATQQVQKNPTFWTRVKSLFGRDTYVTPNGQKICMKAGQGKVEINEKGEVNIFDAVNVKAKGTDGSVDVFNLYNCSGTRNRGKKLNDIGDTFRQMEPDLDTEEEEKDPETEEKDPTENNENTDIKALMDQLMALLKSLMGNNAVQATQTAQVGPVNATQTAQVGDGVQATQTAQVGPVNATQTATVANAAPVSQVATGTYTTQPFGGPGVSFNTINYGNDNIFNVSNNYYAD